MVQPAGPEREPPLWRRVLGGLWGLLGRGGDSARRGSRPAHGLGAAAAPKQRGVEQSWAAYGDYEPPEWGPPPRAVWLGETRRWALVQPPWPALPPGVPPQPWQAGAPWPAAQQWHQPGWGQQAPTQQPRFQPYPPAVPQQAARGAHAVQQPQYAPHFWQQQPPHFPQHPGGEQAIQWQYSGAAQPQQPRSAPPAAPAQPLLGQPKHNGEEESFALRAMRKAYQMRELEERLASSSAQLQDSWSAGSVLSSRVPTLWQDLQISAALAERECERERERERRSGRERGSSPPLRFSSEGFRLPGEAESPKKQWRPPSPEHPADLLDGSAAPSERRGLAPAPPRKRPRIQEDPEAVQALSAIVLARVREHVRVAQTAAIWHTKPRALRDFVAEVPYDIGKLLPQMFDNGARQIQQPLREPDRELLKTLQDHNLGQQEVLARFSPAWENGKFECTRDDFVTLRKGGWLSGNVINYYNKLIEQRCRECPGGLKVRALSSQLYARMMKFGEKVPVTEQDNPERYDFSGVRRWTRRWDPFENDVLLIPVNRGRAHWALACLDTRDGVLTFCDSMGSSGAAPMRNLVRWLNDVYKDKNGGEPWPLLNEILQKSPGKSVPQQSNGADCGVFALLYGSCITAGSQFGFDQDDIPYWRDRVCVEIHAARSPQAP
eukprot:TRINITY_DN721_c0_g1_i1.p1 TRINITY_DN721_c0_g1~~TRINITY_DN721_c0_g1_i1.p1  ORF type:complete len:693 (+),score=197.43 TRINITY_DN721_c0_g1_i1:92-2080(+)